MHDRAPLAMLSPMKNFIVISFTAVFCALGLAPAAAKAQSTTTVEQRTEGALKLRLSKRLNLDASAGVRFNTLDGYTKAVVQISTRYRIKKFLFAAAHGRLYFPPGAMGERVGADLKAVLDLGKLDLSYRVRGQVTFAGAAVKPALRNRIAMDYKLNKTLSPFIAADVTYRFDKGEFRRISAYAGTDIDLGKKFGVGLVYIFSQDINKAAPITKHIIAVDLSYALKMYAKSDKDADDSRGASDRLDDD